MTGSTRPDLACFGYLASAQVTAVVAYPPANSGAHITHVHPSLAADAPITALTARQYGLSVHLVSNRVSVDPAGQAVLDTLDTAGVTHHAVPTSAAAPGTPHLTIVTDQAGTRTWFAWLGTALDQLATADLTALTTARLAYIDCYQLIDAAAAAAITASRAPLLLNLGGDPLSDAVAHAARTRQVAYVQTNLAEPDAHHAPHLAADLHARLHPDTVVITLGRLGAYAHTHTGGFRVPAAQVPVRHTHGAGAAFSAGLAHAHLAGANPRQAIDTACQAGTIHCAATNHIPRPRTNADLIKGTQP